MRESGPDDESAHTKSYERDAELICIVFLVLIFVGPFLPVRLSLLQNFAYYALHLSRQLLSLLSDVTVTVLLVEATHEYLQLCHLFVHCVLQ